MLLWRAVVRRQSKVVLCLPILSLKRVSIMADPKFNVQLVENEAENYVGYVLLPEKPHPVIDVAEANQEEEERIAAKLREQRDLEARTQLANAAAVAQTKSKPTAFTVLLPAIERLAYQGLSVEQIAARIGLKPHEFRNLLSTYPEINDCVIGGRARGADDLSAAAMRAAVSGNTGMIKFLLERRHGYLNPKNETSSVTVNMPGLSAPPTIDHADAMQARQSSYLRRAAEAASDPDAPPSPLKDLLG